MCLYLINNGIIRVRLTFKIEIWLLEGYVPLQLVMIAIN